MSPATIRRTFIGLLLGAVAGLPGTASADDTEIYLGSDSLSEGVRPNVLFILDTSGSMSSSVSGTGKNRLQNMQDAVLGLLDELNNVNVGLMRFTDPGGPILFPVSYIEADADEITNAGTADVNVTIADGSDDAEELGGAMLLDSVRLDLVETAGFGTEGSITLGIEESNDDAEQSPQFMNNTSNQMELTDNSAGNRTTGVRFNNFNVPQGATILHAELDFRSRSDRSGTTNLTITGHDVDDSNPFANGAGSNDIYSRLGDRTTASVAWSNVPEWFSGERYQSPELAPIVSEIVGRTGWVAGNAITFFISGTAGSLRDASTYDDHPTRSAILRVDYVNGGGSGAQKVGLRFRDVRIPQGVTITAAKIEFTASAVNSDAADLVIRAQASDDAPAFTTATNDIGSRTLTSASVGWAPTAWAAVDDIEHTPDLSGVLQEVVDRSGWCGGNDVVFVIEAGANDGPRGAYSYEGDPNRAPVLRVEYDQDTPLAAGEGCMVREAHSQVSASKDDAEQIGSSLYLTSSTLEMVTNGSGTRTNGLRFRDVQVPAGADILSAVISFTSRDNNSGSTSLTFHGHKTADAGQFGTGTGNDVTSRTKTSASVTWSSVPAWSNGVQYDTPNLAPVINEIVNGGTGWVQGNDLAIIISGSGLREVAPFDYNAAYAPSLSITYRGAVEPGTTASQVTVRERLKELVGELTPEGYTPIVDTLYEAARYYRGETVQWGRTRGTGSTSNRRSTRVSHPASYEGGSVYRASGCTDENLGAYECITEAINAAPVYKTPVTESCQANYIVLLTDGEANHNNSYLPISNMIGKWPCDVTLSNGSSISFGEFCGTDLVEYLNTEDQLATVAGDNKVTTYTIGFNFSGQFLKDLAYRGGGSFHTASTATELTGVFRSIFADILSRTTSFATPSLSVNAFNKLFHRNEVYFSLFKPADEVRWSGNVKKYQLCEDESTGCDLGEVLDARQPPDGPVPAIGADQRIKDEALSFWSDTVDGSQILVGGAGNETPAPALRKVYTYTGAGAPSNVDLTLSAHAIADANSALTVELLGGSTDTASPLYMSATERTALINWMRGQDVDDQDGDGDTAEARYSFTDPLHSSPVAVTYGGTEAAPVIKLFVGTNDGGIRMINSTNGTEEWIFYPQQMLEDQRALRSNASGNHIYGVDGTPTAWINDENNDGIVDPSVDVDGDGTYEFVRLFVGMRRGGESIFALDVTPATATGPLTNPESISDVSPTLLWRIDSGGDFPRLGQTWSRPRLATMRIGTTTAGASVTKTVLVFAGGYDEAQDTAFASGGQGNAIYIVDPDDGSRLFYISSNGSGSHGAGPGVTVSGMTYPIPSDVALMDANGDGLTDRLYVGDTGGQLWRADFKADLSTSAGIKAVVGKLATVSAVGSPLDERKFFYPPDVVQVTESRFSSVSEYDLVTAVTGNRASPLSQTVQDRFYAFRDYTVDGLVDGDPLDTADDDGLADGYTTLLGPLEGNAPVVNSRVGDLFDVTNANDPAGDALTELQEADGYYLDFEASGEKGLAGPIILAGKVFFTSYQPDGVVQTSTCAIAEGAGVLYGLNVLNGAAVFNWDGTGADDALTKNDRVYQLGGGIPSSAVPIFQEEGITLLIGGGGGATTVDPLIALPRVRTYWYEDGID